MDDTGTPFEKQTNIIFPVRHHLKIPLQTMNPDVSAAANLVMVHRYLRGLSGRHWAANIEPWISVVRRHATRRKIDPMLAMREIVEQMIDSGEPEIHIAYAMAAYVEIEERLHT